MVKSIHRRDMFNWHTFGKASLSLRSPWISISKSWLEVEDLAVFKLGLGIRIAFWHDTWVNKVPFKVSFIKLFRIAFSPNGSVMEHWDPSTSSWSTVFRRLLKEDKIEEFQRLLNLISNIIVR